MVAEQQQTDNVDYVAQADTRKRNFISRTAAAVTGSIAAVFLGKRKLRKSLREYVSERLFNRNWKDSAVENVFDAMLKDKVDTYTGAPTRPATIMKYSEDYVAGLLDGMPGTLVGDEKVFDAVKHLLKSKSENEKFSPFITKLLEGWQTKLKEHLGYHAKLNKELEAKYFIEGRAEAARAITHVIEHTYANNKDRAAKDAAVEALGDAKLFKIKPSEYFLKRRQIQELGKTAPEFRENRLQELDAIAFGDEAAQKKGLALVKAIEDSFEFHKQETLRKKGIAMLHAVDGVLDTHGIPTAKADIHARIETILSQPNLHAAEEEIMRKAISALDMGGLFKASPLKFFEQKFKIDKNLEYHTNISKKKFVDIPIYDELIKDGKEAEGHMGLSLRHAHNKGEILAFAAVAAVTVGAVTHKAVKAYLGRNEKKREEQGSFQTAVMAQRDAAAKQGQQAVSPA